MTASFPVIITILGLLSFGVCLLMYRQVQTLKAALANQSTLQHASQEELRAKLNQSEQNLQSALYNNKQSIIESGYQRETSMNNQINTTLTQKMSDIREQIQQSFKQHAQSLSHSVSLLNNEVKTHLQQINQRVDNRLQEGFDKTHATFTDIVKRLTIIDEAQKKMTVLSDQVVSLHRLLNDKQARGAFGEVQLSILIENTLPEKSFSYQYTLSNQKRADCILFLPPPTGNIVIDSKFPMTPYHDKQTSSSVNDKLVNQQFKQAIKKHINDVADKYIVTNETADSAIIFIPAESIFAEIHANHPDLVEYSHQKRVWLTSPNTLMAILTTAKAVLRDEATRKQVHVIRHHLNVLADDFSRFEKRMQNLSKHISQAHQDVNDVNISAKKISAKFNKIEQLDIGSDEERSIAVSEVEDDN